MDFEGGRQAIFSMLGDVYIVLEGGPNVAAQVTRIKHGKTGGSERLNVDVRRFSMILLPIATSILSQRWISRTRVASWWGKPTNIYCWSISRIIPPCFMIKAYETSRYLRFYLKNIVLLHSIWHSFWHKWIPTLRLALDLAFCLAFCLAYFLTFYVAFYLTYMLALWFLIPSVTQMWFAE